jgi:hypothetical protein
VSDRLALAHAIEEAGIQREKAENIASVVIRLVEGSVATKADVQAMGTELKADIATVRAELKADIAATRAELKMEIATVRGDFATLRASTRADINDAKAEIRNWMLAQTFAILALVTALHFVR